MKDKREIPSHDMKKVCKTQHLKTTFPAAVKFEMISQIETVYLSTYHNLCSNPAPYRGEIENIQNSRIPSRWMFWYELGESSLFVTEIETRSISLECASLNFVPYGTKIEMKNHVLSNPWN